MHRSDSIRRRGVLSTFVAFLVFSGCASEDSTTILSTTGFSVSGGTTTTLTALVETITNGVAVPNVGVTVTWSTDDTAKGTVAPSSGTTGLAATANAGMHSTVFTGGAVDENSRVRVVADTALQDAVTFVNVTPTIGSSTFGTGGDRVSVAPSIFKDGDRNFIYTLNVADGDGDGASDMEKVTITFETAVTVTATSGPQDPAPVVTPATGTSITIGNGGNGTFATLVITATGNVDAGGTATFVIEEAGTGVSTTVKVKGPKA